MVQITKKALTYGMDKEYVERFFGATELLKIEKAYYYEHNGNKLLVEVTRKWSDTVYYVTKVVINGKFKTIEGDAYTLAEAKELIKGVRK